MPIQHSVFIAYQTEKTVQIWATELTSIVNDDGDILQLYYDYFTQ